MPNELTDWTWKKLSLYRSCPLSVKLRYIDRAPRPEQDPKYEEKRLRGIRLHEAAANCINLGSEVPKELKHIEELIDDYRAVGAKAEEEWFFDNQWNYIPGGSWDKPHWLYVGQDVFVEDPEYILTGDWKSGKKHGNEVSHFEQMRLYSVAAWRRFPGRKKYISELQYIDQDDTWAVEFTEKDMEKAIGDFDRDVEIMMNDQIFRPRPNKITCKYCDFSPRGSGACPVGV